MSHLTAGRYYRVPTVKYDCQLDGYYWSLVFVTHPAALANRAKP